MKKYKKIVNIIYSLSMHLFICASTILCCITGDAALKLWSEIMHTMSSCTTNDYIVDEISSMIVMSLLCIYFGTAATMTLLWSIYNEVEIFEEV